MPDFHTISYPINCSCGGKAFALTTKHFRCRVCGEDYLFASDVLPAAYHPNFPYPEIVDNRKGMKVKG